MFSFHYNGDCIYGNFDIYYYSMRILRDYLSGIKKNKIDLDKFEDIYDLGLNITNRIIDNKTELPNETVVFKLIKSMKREHFLEFIESYCVDIEIPYTTNIEDIDLREFLMYVCSELIGIYKHEMIEGWTENKWEK